MISFCGSKIARAIKSIGCAVPSALKSGPIVPPLVQRGLIYAAAFSPDGNRVITASADKTARIWNLPLPDRGSLDDWRAIARCSLFTLINGVLTSNPEPDLACSSRAASTERAMSDEAAP